jgi:hypothetical protein
MVIYYILKLGVSEEFAESFKNDLKIEEEKEK